MNNNKVCNPKTEVPNGMELNDKDYLTIVLTCLKDMEKNYVIAMTEASNENLYNKIHDMFCEFTNLQREVYELMFKNGWYSLEKAPSTKINEKYQMLNDELTSLN